MKTTTLLTLATLIGCGANSSLETSYLRHDHNKPLGAAHQQLAYAMRVEYQAQAMKVEPPLGLTPSDGAELALTSLVAEVTLDGPLAHTELHFKFKNTENRQREGRFKIELPDGAAVSKFAMLIGKEWRESRVVAREQGRQVYETFLHQRVDPALLEQDLGNQFSARVFPIPANAEKELIVGYDHMVSSAQPYTLALRGLPVIPKLSIAVNRADVRNVTERGGVTPEDFTLPIEAGDVAVTGGGAFVARIDALAATGAPASLDKTLFLVDTSASRHHVMGKQADLMQRVLSELGDAEVAVAAYDQSVTELYRGPAKSADIANKLYEHGALGASNLGAAIARASAAGMKRIVIVGDGVLTQGELSVDKLVAVVRGKLRRVDAIQIGGSLSRETLAPLVAAGTSPGAILDAREASAIVHALGHAVPAEQRISVAGATEVWPKTTRGLMPGRSLFITGRGKAPAKITVGDHVVALRPFEADAKRVARAAGRAEVGELGERLALAKTETERAMLDQQIERVALQHNLVSSKTSLLVLESDADEQRMLGTPPKTAGEDRGETIRITGSAPMIDATSTRQGITIDRNYTRNIPLQGRTFEGAVGAAAGAQNDGRGVRFSGASSIENTYYVDGVNARSNGTTRVSTDTMSGLGLDHMARYLQSNVFAFGLPRQVRRQAAAPTPSTPDDVSPLNFTRSPYTDELAVVMSALLEGNRKDALAKAAAWQSKRPGELASLIGLGEALEAAGAMDAAARAYGSIIDLYPNRFELVRAAGERFDRLGRRELAVDAYKRSLKERPDQLSTYRLLAFALFRTGKADEALDRLLEARSRSSSSVHEVMLQDAKVIAASIAAKDPSRRGALEKRLGTAIPTTPSLHVVLAWETDANDVDLHVVDKHGDHAFYSKRALASGGTLLDDLTDGYGPEMFSISKPKAFPYQLAVHYFNRGPMGLGIGTVQVIRHDGRGNLAIEDRPFVLQTDGATIPLGTVSER